jgi:hypothetical protein
MMRTLLFLEPSVAAVAFIFLGDVVVVCSRLFERLADARATVDLEHGGESRVLLNDGDGICWTSLVRLPDPSMLWP